jgi:hypothetical protein
VSRHYFDCEHLGQPLRITLGYDPPLNEYFLQVQSLKCEQQDPTFLYASVDDPKALVNDLEYFHEQLAALGLSAPESLFEAVELDAARRVGNKVVEHFGNGQTRIVVGETRD